jgi:hypothetical protein
MADPDMVVWVDADGTAHSPLNMPAIDSPQRTLVLQIRDYFDLAKSIHALPLERFRGIILDELELFQLFVVQAESKGTWSAASARRSGAHDPHSQSPRARQL